MQGDACRCPNCLYLAARRANDHPGGGLPIFVIYERPSDFPEHYVLRLWIMDRPTLAAWTFDELDAARAAVPEGLFAMNRQAADDPQIVELWL